MGEQDKINELGVRLANVRADIADLKDIENEIKEELKDRLAPDFLGEIDIEGVAEGSLQLVVGPNSTFNAAAAKKNLTAQEYRAILAPTPNAKLAKEVLGDRYHLAQNHNGQKFTLKWGSEDDD